MKKSTFKKLNGFDSFFFMYHEDTDFSLRAIRKGISIFTTNETTLHHQKIQMMLNDFTYYYIERNRFLTIYKNADKIITLIPYLIISEIMLIFQAISIRVLKLRFKIYKFLLQNYHTIRHLRFNEYNNRDKKLGKQFFDDHLDIMVLGRVLSKVKILRFFFKPI